MKEKRHPRMWTALSYRLAADGITDGRLAQAFFPLLPLQCLGSSTMPSYGELKPQKP